MRAMVSWLNLSPYNKHRRYNVGLTVTVLGGQGDCSTQMGCCQDSGARLAVISNARSVSSLRILCPNSSP